MSHIVEIEVMEIVIRDAYQWKMLHGIIQSPETQHIKWNKSNERA